MSEKKDIVGLGLAALGGFLLGKSLKKDDDQEIDYLKSERKRLMDERDDVILEYEIATQKDYVSPDDRLLEFNDEEEYDKNLRELEEEMETIEFTLGHYIRQLQDKEFGNKENDRFLKEEIKRLKKELNSKQTLLFKIQDASPYELSEEEEDTDIED